MIVIVLIVVVNVDVAVAAAVVVVAVVATSLTYTKPASYSVFHLIFNDICPTFKTKVSFFHLIPNY